jgi:hypothetical protein
MQAGNLVVSSGPFQTPGDDKQDSPFRGRRVFPVGFEVEARIGPYIVVFLRLLTHGDELIVKALWS